MGRIRSVRGPQVRLQGSSHLSWLAEGRVDLSSLSRSLLDMGSLAEAYLSVASAWASSSASSGRQGPSLCRRAKGQQSVVWSVALPERELGEPERQVGAGGLVERADNPALELRPDASNVRGVDAAASVLSYGVVDGLGRQPVVNRPVVAGPSAATGLLLATASRPGAPGMRPWSSTVRWVRWGSTCGQYKRPKALF